MQKYSGQQWCRDISESGPTVARQWPDSARQGPTPRQSGLKDTGPAVRHVRHPRHLRHARHSDTRHSDTLRHDPRVSLSNHPQTLVRHRPDTSDTVDTSVNRHRSDTAPTLLRHLRHLRHSDTSGLKCSTLRVRLKQAHQTEQSARVPACPRVGAPACARRNGRVHTELKRTAPPFPRSSTPRW